MKKYWVLVFALLMLAGGCTQTSTPEPATQIGIITNTRSQNEIPFLAAARLAAREEEIGHFSAIHAVWPDNFISEQAEVREIVFSLAGNPAIGALVINQAIPGSLDALEQAADLREEFFVALCSPSEAAPTIAAQAGLILALDREAQGKRLGERAQWRGAQTLVYYYLARNFEQQTTDSRWFAGEFIQAAHTCTKLGIQFVPVIIPESAGDSTEPSASQVLADDLPRRVAEYGPDTAFYAANCYLQPTLISQVMEQGALFLQTCCPSPYHGLPQAAGLELTEENYNDYDRLHSQITQGLAAQGYDRGLTGYTVDWQDLETRAAFAYTEKWLQGEVSSGDVDLDVLQAIMREIAGVTCYLRYYENDGLVYKNYVLYSLDHGVRY